MNLQFCSRCIFCHNNLCISPYISKDENVPSPYDLMTEEGRETQAASNAHKFVCLVALYNWTAPIQLHQLLTINHNLLISDIQVFTVQVRLTGRFLVYITTNFKLSHAESNSWTICE